MTTKPISWIYVNNTSNTLRFALGEKSNNMVACIGINPSTAEPSKLDNTIQSVKRIAAFNGFDGWLMVNVYPQRATDPKYLHQEVDHTLPSQNIEVIRGLIEDLGVDTVWLAYGNLIESRDYLSECMINIFSALRHLNLNWKIIDVPTQLGHPRHPLYKSGESLLVDFDIDEYIDQVLKQVK